MKVHIVKKWKSPRAPNYECYQNLSRFVRWYFWKRLDVAFKMCNINREDVVLDVGCWMGYFLPTLAKYSDNVIGLDIWKEVCGPGAWDKRVIGWSTMKIAKELLDTELGSDSSVRLIKADGCALPLKDNSVNVLFCLDTTEHVPSVDNLLFEFYRVLKDEGVFISSLPIELGGALLLRQIFSKLVGVVREKYSIIDLIKTVFKWKVPEEMERGGGHHRGYDYRKDIQGIKKYFRIQKIKYVPIRFLFGLNPTVIIKAVKK